MEQESLESVREFVAQSGGFNIQVTPRNVRHYYDERGSLPAHDAVLRPILAAASACWVYEIDPASAVYRAADGILERIKGKYRVRLDRDPIQGREFFWNAHGGKRGTIVIFIPRAKFDPDRLLSGGHGVYVSVNFRSGHTPAALRFARNHAESADEVAVCLPRNNGIEWINVFARRSEALELFDNALRVCGVLKF